MGEYELLGVLGRGGLSTVHLAAPVGTRRRVALKRVALPRPDAAAAAAFLADVAAATPVHPAVLRPLTTFVHEGEPWLVLRVMAGGSLRGHAGALSPVQLARVLVPVLDALDAAGRRGIAHGDLRPENVLLGPRGAVMVADFGLVAAHERARRCRERGTWIGTPGYAAPERARSEGATPAADLFAVGAMAHELLSGGGAAGRGRGGAVARRAPGRTSSRASRSGSTGSRPAPRATVRSSAARPAPGSRRSWPPATGPAGARRPACPRRRPPTPGASPPRGRCGPGR